MAPLADVRQHGIKRRLRALVSQLAAASRSCAMQPRVLGQRASSRLAQRVDHRRHRAEPGHAERGEKQTTATRITRLLSIVHGRPPPIHFQAREIHVSCGRTLRCASALIRSISARAVVRAGLSGALPCFFGFAFMA